MSEALSEKLCSKCNLISNNCRYAEDGYDGEDEPWYFCTKRECECWTYPRADLTNCSDFEHGYVDFENDNRYFLLLLETVSSLMDENGTGISFMKDSVALGAPINLSSSDPKLNMKQKCIRLLLDALETDFVGRDSFVAGIRGILDEESRKGRNQNSI